MSVGIWRVWNLPWPLVQEGHMWCGWIQSELPTDPGLGVVCKALWNIWEILFNPIFFLNYERIVKFIIERFILEELQENI